jgi:hypothetical protein
MNQVGGVQYDLSACYFNFNLFMMILSEPNTSIRHPKEL